MDTSWLEKARLLRDQAFEVMEGTAEYRAFKVFDDAVVRLGGNPKFDEHGLIAVHDSAKQIVEAAARRMADGKKLSQGDAAEMVLEQRGHPLSINKLLEAALERGAEVRGNDQLANFRSNMSRDTRFRPVKINGAHLWWLANKPLSPTWNDTAGRTLLDEPAGSSVSSDQEGGDGHGPATT